MDESTLRRLLDSALLTGVFADRPVPASTAQTATMLDVLATLPPRARAVLVLRYWASLSVEQVAGFLGCSARTVASDNAQALEKLGAVLEEVIVGPAGGPGSAQDQSGGRPHG